MRTMIQKREQIYQGNLILVNAQYAYREDKEYTKVDVEGEMLALETAEALNALMFKMDGWKQIVVVSGWRSMKEQQSIWDESIQD